jgi:hypothetical protein
MVKLQGWEYGKRALERSKSRIQSVLYEWDYEKDGEVTPQKISKKINMGIQTVYRHWGEFRLRVLEINKTKR